jgi:hypothetical protein
MPSFSGGHSILIKEKVEWYAFLRRYRLPFSLKQNRSWSMDVDDFEVIIDVLRGYRADESVCVVELGSGISTLVLAHIVPQLHDNAHIISVEGEGSYAQQLQGQIKRYALEDSVSLHQAPYAKDDDDGCWFRKDALRCILNNKRVDILIVDAPPGRLCRRARQPAIPFFLPYLKQEGIVFLHDTCREDESAIADVWGRYFLTRREIDTPKGIALFVGSSQGRWQLDLAYLKT